jgi:Mrp family chromosome partitioning ATPase
VIEPPTGDLASLDEHLVSLLAPSSPGAEQYRVLRHVVETLRKRAKLQVVAITSPGVGDGKTVTAINLAGALAQALDARVLLADLDLRRPSVAKSLGLGAAQPTLADVLASPDLALKDAVAPLPRFNFSVLRAPASVAAPYELLRSPRLEALMVEARAQYDYVVVDTPPFAPMPDCRLIAKCVDGFAVVIAAHRTPRGLLAETLKAMDPEKTVGLVFNANDARSVRYEETYGRKLPWRRVEEIA